MHDRRPSTIRGTQQNEMNRGRPHATPVPPRHRGGGPRSDTLPLLPGATAGRSSRWHEKYMPSDSPEAGLLDRGGSRWTEAAQTRGRGLPPATGQLLGFLRCGKTLLFKRRQEQAGRVAHRRQGTPARPCQGWGVGGHQGRPGHSQHQCGRLAGLAPRRLHQAQADGGRARTPKGRPGGDRRGR